MTAAHPPLVRTRLSILMFLQFFIWGGWGFALAGYAANTLHFEGWQVGWLLAIPALGAIISPLFMGLIADRWFATERVLCVLHLLGGACLFVAGQQSTFPLLMAFMMLHGLLFMPTIALANSVAFRHIPDPTRFPRIAVLGTIGWIVAVLVASVFLGGMASPKFLYLSGGGAVLLGLYCLTLPHTPPQGKGAGGSAFGLDALKLLREPSFLVFIVCVFLVSIPACGFFFTLAGPMLQQRGYPSPLALTTLNQFSEIIFMFSMPWFVAQLGLKRVLGIGMLAWAVRYFCFVSPAFSLALVGLLLHGFCYSFFYVAAYMYVDKRAPAELKASAQSLLAFLLLGVGFFLGAQLAGYMLDRFPAQIASMPATELPPRAGVAGQPVAKAPLPAWNDPQAAASVWRYLDLTSTINRLRTGKEPAPTPDLAQKLDGDQDGTITMAEVQATPDTGLELGGLVYARDDLAATFRAIAALGGKPVADEDIRLTRDNWLAAQACTWEKIWFWPAVVSLLIFLIFMVAFRDRAPETPAPATP